MPSYLLKHEDDDPGNNGRPGDPDQCQDSAFLQNLRPGLYKWYLFCAGYDPEPAVADPKTVDYDPVVPVHNFQKETPIFKKKIEDCLFCFEDFQYLDDRAIQKVLRETDMQELAKALKGASTEVQAKIFRNMPQRSANMLKEDMEWMGPVRAQDVDAAQANLVKIVFRLSNNGDILLTLKEDLEKVYK